MSYAHLLTRVSFVAVAVAAASGAQAMQSGQADTGQTPTGPGSPVVTCPPVPKSDGAAPAGVTAISPEQRCPPSQSIADPAAQAKPEPANDAPAPEVEQSVEAAPTVQEQSGDIVVRGVRSSLAEAREDKRNADQIVDVIKAEDVGKLPANTVGDVVAYIPGIQVGRDEGEVGDIQLRGLGQVQTTINGAESFSSLDRTAFIQDLPADLIKTVEVYKNSTPDQIEGSGSGSINIELRRPLDFKRGFSAFGIATARYNDQSKRYFQNYTGIVNYRAETGIGEIGLLLSGTYNANPYLESKAFNDVLGTVQTRQVTGAQLPPNPAVAPTQVAFFYNDGLRSTRSYSASLQWRPTDRLSIVLEGNLSDIRQQRTINQFYVPILTQAGSTNTLPALSNIVLVPGTNRFASVSVSPVTQLGPIMQMTDILTDQYYGKLAIDYKTERFDLVAQLNYNSSKANVNEQTTRNRFVNRPSYDVEFASDKYKFPQVDVQFRDVDLLDPAQYRFFQLDESLRKNDGTLLEGRLDMTLRTFASFIDYFKVGVRGAFRTYLREVRPRSVTGLSLPASQLPAPLNNLIPISEGFQGTGVENNARWLSYDRKEFKANLPAIHDFLGQYSTAFTTPEGPLNQGDYFTGTEDSLAVYGQFHYKFKLIFPVDGIIGARIINTLIDLDGFERVTRVGVVNGTNQTIAEFRPTNTKQNGLDVNPSASMRIRFNDKLQLRLGYTSSINRPRTYDLTPYIDFNESTLIGTGGNTNLQPSRTTKYDASLEYYFGRTGLISIAPFWWNLSGTIGTFQTQEIVPGTDTVYTINRPINAGAGYRRGFEVQGQTFFTFLPGILQNFGVAANYTHVDSKLNYPAREGVLNLPVGDVPIPNTAPNSYNIVGLFERGGLSARFSYNFRDKLITTLRSPVRDSDYLLPVSWFEANISYRFIDGPLRNLSIGVQAQNLGASARRSFYGYPDQPREVAYMARTYGLNARYNF